MTELIGLHKVLQSPQYRELDNIDGEPSRVQVKMLPGHTTLKLLQEVQSNDGEK